MRTKWTVLPLSLVFAVALADEPELLTKEEIAAKLSGVAASDITESPVAGVYEVAVGSNVAYVTENGRYLLQGELYDLETSENLTERTRSTARIDLLASVDPESMIVFAPEDAQAKYSVTIFTDIDCGYCRQFHREIAEVNALGIEVHYLFYPRTGPDTDSWEKANRVWCAEDRNSALTRAKLGGAVPEATCGDTPVAAHYSLGKKVGVPGTPAVFTASGEHIGGYLPPATLLKRLEESAQ